MDDFLDIRVRSSAEIAARILIQHALIQRLFIEDLIAEFEVDEEDDPDELSYDLHLFLEESGIRPWLTTADRSYLGPTMGELSPLQKNELLDATAGLEQLLAATTPDPVAIRDELGELTILALAKRLEPPDDDRAAELREVAEILHWRAAIEVELRETKRSERQELRDLIRETAAEASEAGLIGLTASGDIDIGGTPMGELDKYELTMYLVDATIRLKVLNWLCGFGLTWYDVPLEV